jgi:outer membrane autotransporter protein
LSGSGTITGNVTAGSATLSPGNSIGTLTINGNASFAAGSTYRVEFVGAAADLLTVTGTANLAGTIQLVAGGGSYSFNAPYTVLTASAGVSGTFGTVTTAGSFGVGVTSEVSYGTNDVKVTLKPGSLVDAGSGATSNPTAPSSNPVYGTASGLSLNAWSVAAAIDRAVANGADPSFLYQVYARGDREALLAALRTLTGEVHSATGTLGLSAASGFLTAALDPFAAGRDPNAMPNGFGAFTTSGAYASSGSAAELPSTKGMTRAPRFTPDRLYTVWGQVFGSVNRTDGDRFLGTTAQNGSSGHIALGVDVRVLPDTVIGAALGAGEARTSLSGQLGSAKAEILQAGLYGVTRIGALSLGAALGYASADTETTRVIPLLAAFAVKGQVPRRNLERARRSRLQARQHRPARAFALWRLHRPEPAYPGLPRTRQFHRPAGGPCRCQPHRHDLARRARLAPRCDHDPVRRPHRGVRQARLGLLRPARRALQRLAHRPAGLGLQLRRRQARPQCRPGLGRPRHPLLASRQPGRPLRQRTFQECPILRRLCDIEGRLLRGARLKRPTSRCARPGVRARARRHARCRRR